MFKSHRYGIYLNVLLGLMLLFFHVDCHQSRVCVC